MKGFLLLAATPFDPPDFSPFWQRYIASKNETILMLSAISGVVLVVLVWAIFIRKRKDEDARRYSYRRSSTRESKEESANPSSDANSTSQSSQGKRRRRRRRRGHRPRNPTLAEAGGLPPVRTESFTEDPP